MFNEILVRLKQGYRTIKFPAGKPPALPNRFRGLPVIDWAKCKSDCHACASVCPTGAISPQNKAIDLSKCLFCNDCTDACPVESIRFTGEYRLSVRKKEDLILHENEMVFKLSKQLDRKMKSLFGRSLKLRQVSAGGCNGCEADTNVLSTIGWDLGRFGIQFVASPRHADGILITGPVTKNMELALKKTWDAIPDPKIAIAVGSCALSGGPFIGHDEQNNGADTILPIDLYIPGCPPHPLTILDGLLRLLGRIK